MMRNAFVCLSMTVICGLAMTGGARAADRTNLVGVLRDPETGLRLNRVELALVDPGDYRVVTRDDGRFVFEDIPVGTHRFLFAYLGDDTGIRRSILLAKDIEVWEGRDPLVVERRLLREHPEDRAPSVAAYEFEDGRSREFTQFRVLREPLGQRWPRQYVSFRFNFEPNRCRRPSLRVVDGATGREVPFQLSDVTRGREDTIRSCVITFPSSLDPFERKIYVVAHDWRPGFLEPDIRTDLDIEVDEATGSQVLSNSKMAVRLPPAEGTGPIPADEAQAPILELRGPDHQWFGRGRFISDRTIESFTAELTEDGPLFKQFEITYQIAAEEGETEEDEKPPAAYVMALRLYADSDYLVIGEQMTGEADLEFRLEIDERFDADQAAFVQGGRPWFATVRPEVEQTTTLAVFRAWNPPGVRNSHDWYGLMTSGDRRDAVGLVQIDGLSWNFAERQQWADQTWLTYAADTNEVRLVKEPGGELNLLFPHRPGSRRFALTVFDRTRNWDPATLAEGRPSGDRTHHLNRLHMELSQIDMQRLPEMQIPRARTAGHPRLLFNPDTFERWKSVYRENPERIPDVLSDVFTGSRRNTELVRSHIIGTVEHLRRGFLGGGPATELAGYNSRLLHPYELGPHVKFAALLYDAHVASGLFSSLEQEWILGTLAMVASRLEDPNYRLRFAHDADQSAEIDTTLTVLGLLLDGHPRSMSWSYEAERRMRSHLQQINALGGVPLDTGLLLGAMNRWARIAPIIESARGAGSGESPYQWPGFSTVLGTLPALTAPPDRGAGGVRLLPTIGRSRPDDRAGLAFLGEAAERIAPISPDLAGHLAWAWEQAGSPPLLAGAGRYEALLGVFRDDVEPVDPIPLEDMQSGPLPGFGSIFRSEFGTPEEALLLFRSSPSGASVHHDQLGLLLHAFGAPLLLDCPDRPATWAHNTVRIDSRTHAAGAQLTEFYQKKDDGYAVARLRIDALSDLREYTAEEFRRLRDEAEAEGREFVPPPGHRTDGTQTADLLPATDRLDEPIEVTRHVLFNEARQYAVVLDRIKGRLPADVFYNVRAEDARIEGDTARFVGPYGVDLDVHMFGIPAPDSRMFKSGADRWTVQISSVPTEDTMDTAPENDEAEDEQDDELDVATPEDEHSPAAEEPEDPPVPLPETEEIEQPDVESPDEELLPPDMDLELPEVETPDEDVPVMEIISVVCPIRRGEPGKEGDIAQYGPPEVEKLDGVSGVKVSHGKTTRYVFLAREPIEYQDDEVTFRGKRGILTVRPTHFDIVLFDGGEVRYKGTGVAIDFGPGQFRFAPGGFVDGEVSGREDKELTFYGLGRRHRRLEFRIDGQEYQGRSDARRIIYGVPAELHRHPDGRRSISIRPK